MEEDEGCNDLIVDPSVLYAVSIHQWVDHPLQMAAYYRSRFLALHRTYILPSLPLPPERLDCPGLAI